MEVSNTPGFQRINAKGKEECNQFHQVFYISDMLTDNILDILGEEKDIKMCFTCLFSCSNVATRTVSITHAVCIIFPLESAAFAMDSSRGSLLRADVRTFLSNDGTNGQLGCQNKAAFIASHIVQ